MALCIKSIGWRISALALTLAAPQLAAQSLWVPGSDPVTIARSGAGVAFGRSLEAAGANPALLPTLTDVRSFQLGLGMAMESHQVTLRESNQPTHFTSDRNRFMPSFGAGWKLGDRFSAGVQVADSFRRNGRLDWDAPARFDGLALDLAVRRAEFQGGFSVTPAFSLGFGVGLQQISYSAEAPIRVVVSGDLGQSLLEAVAGQKANKTVPSFTLGFRWALAPRWTIGGSFRSGVDTTLGLEGYRVDRPLLLVGSDGFGVATAGIEPAAKALADGLRPVTGDPRLKLPAQLQVGVRQRVNQLFTWEGDIYFVMPGAMLPAMPGYTGTTGVIQAPQNQTEGKGGMGVRACGEFSVSKNWVFRMGMSVDPSFRKDEDSDVLVNGTRAAAFSGGMAWQALGGELSMGYQFRQTQDRESSRMGSNWKSTGYHRGGNLVRIEAQGHLWSIGYRATF